MNQILRYTSILILLLLSIPSLAQESSCAFKLEEAEAMYETGILDSIPSILRSCINNDGFDNEELARAYKLLIKTYLFEDYQEMAELTMLKFLKDFPGYEIKPTDPVEFTYLYKSYQTIPIYSIGFIIGGNYSFVRIIEPHSIDNTENYAGEYYPVVNFQVGIQLKRYINENIEINLDGIYTLKGTYYEITQNNYKTIYEEYQTILSFPVTGTYDFNLGIWSPYLRAGFNVDYMIKATAYFDYNDKQYEEKDVDIINERNRYNISAVIGGGVKYNIKRGYLMLDVRYHLGFMNNVNPDTRYSLDYKWANYGYVDDDFALNNLFISVGYVYPFYRTKQNK
ncbi:MAG: PorT family protein [Bacteroidales bacterium]|nr:PorT family protein [Bacteroidales bacterium]